ncbi:MAG: T9SS type A sorting domain-containing protein [Flavobacteriia bacterium]|nr:T9SS type A sorting domain-containing protein [Flavobacteriia bacterium]
MIRNLLYTFIALIGGTCTIQAQIYDNGPLYNSSGTGAGGANQSILYTTTFGMGTIGFGQQQTTFNRIADDFTVDCEWTIDSIYLYGYQTGSTTTSTFTGYTLRIWDGVPDAVGSNVIWGDTTTNRLIRSVFSNVYRVTETTSGNSTRPIMQNTVNIGGFTLPAGTYWFDWAATGSLASGPWQPSRVPPGQAITGNGRQRIGGTWNNLLDGGTGTPAQGAPFKVFGTAASVTANAGIDVSLCSNTIATLGGSPAGVSSVNSPLIYVWQGIGISDTTLSNPTIVVSDTLQYMLTVSDTNGCVGMDTITITSLPVNAISIDVTETAFCMGESDILVANQPFLVSWSTGDTTNMISVYSGGVYIAYFTDVNGCSTSDTAIVSVWSLPSLTVNDLIVCDGDQVQLIGTSANPIFWNDTIANGTFVDVTQTIDYTASVADTNGCVSVDTITVTLAPLPTLTVPTDLTICEGESVVLIGTSDSPVFWNDTIVNGTTVNPTQTSSYVASTVDTNSCSSQATFTVNVNLATTGTTSVSGLDSVTVNGVTYYQDGVFTQSLTNAQGCDSVLTITVSLDFTGLNELDNSLFSAAPNPMNDFLMVHNLSDHNADFIIINIAGQVVLSFSTDEAYTKVDVSSLSSGTYLLVDRVTNQRKLLVKQ